MPWHTFVATFWEFNFNTMYIVTEHLKLYTFQQTELYMETPTINCIALLVKIIACCQKPIHFSLLCKCIQWSKMKKTFSYAMWSSSTLFTWQVLQPNKTLNKIQRQINYKTNFGTKKCTKRYALSAISLPHYVKYRRNCTNPLISQETDRWNAELKTAENKAD